ncbi:MAG: FHA domain-containing protein [Deltaproteobacteria bacterium]|nr:FHA domain-containing protein [Deltaproteobacteria bacterium]
MFKLVIQDDEGKTTVVPLIRDEITIGRKEGNTIRLTERNVSRRHARIVRNNGEVQIEDLGSYNGIRVNNARIAERVSLRISDQVQIGDYKLYLKAEGVEQVDDARTMPIERIDTSTATDVIPAIPAPTQPMAVPPTITATSAAQQAAPTARMAIADTDPAGRPVATAATVAALTTPVGYGKLVVLSSNFAGKEFELSRPQMIVGRTDENDICINHRSISRNHAKLVREPDTGRYTISDLQSSNGVRVNGQDYGKVELRRGDVVDLGHVRLRFVEPGEDFVFARDAVITDVPDGGKRGLLVAIVLGVLVLGGVVTYLVLKTPTETKTANGSGSQGVVDNPIDAALVAVVTPGSDAGSDTPLEAVDAGIAAVTPADAAVVATPGSTLSECMKLKDQKKWAALQDCSNLLAPTDPANAKDLGKRAKDELVAENALFKVSEAVREKSLEKAWDALNKIGQSSVYRPEAQRLYDQLEGNVRDAMLKKGRAFAQARDCKSLDKLASQAPNQGIEREIKKIDCKEAVATQNNGSGTVVTPPQPSCDAEALKAKGLQDMGASLHAAALTSFEAAWKCSPSPLLIRLVANAACNAGNAAKAKKYYPMVPAQFQTNVQQTCLRTKTPFQ